MQKVTPVNDATKSKGESEMVEPVSSTSQCHGYIKRIFHHDDIVSSIKIHGLLVAVAGWDRKIIIRNIHNSEVIHSAESLIIFY